MEIKYQFFKTYFIFQGLFTRAMIDQLNNEIRSDLLKRGNIKDSDFPCRAVLKSDYLLINSHGTLSEDRFKVYIICVLKTMGFELTETIFNDEQLAYLDDVRPSYDYIGNRTYGGVSSDTRSIDDGVAPLCAVINNIEGLETFASCDGHSGVKTLYILYTVTSLELLTSFTKLFTKTVNEIRPNYIFANEFTLSFLFGYGEWHSGDKLYFEFRANYKPIDTKKVFKFIKDLAEKIETRAKGV